MIEYETPISCLRRLMNQDESEEFCIIVKESKIRTTLNKARAISDKIDQLHLIDPTVNEFTLKLSSSIQNQIETKELIECIILLLKSTQEKIKINKEKENSIILTQYLLGSEDDQLLGRIKINNIQDAISFLSTELHRTSVKYLSDHLIEVIESGKLKTIDESITKAIIDEYFYKQIGEKKPNNLKEIRKIFSLLQKKEDSQIVMHFLLNLNYCDFNSEMLMYISSNLSDEIINNELGRIIRKFQEQILKQLSQNNNNNITKIDYAGNELSGIFTYLNITNGTFKISDSQLPTSGGKIDNLTKFDKENLDKFYTNQNDGPAKKSEGWINFDFGPNKINLSSYTIRTCSSSSNGYSHPKTWQIVGSNDGLNWDVLDTQTNNSILNGKYKQHRFECEKNDNFYQYIRFIQKDSWYHDQNYKYNIYLTCIEFFGSLLSP